MNAATEIGAAFSPNALRLLRKTLSDDELLRVLAEKRRHLTVLTEKRDEIAKRTQRGETGAAALADADRAVTAYVVNGSGYAVKSFDPTFIARLQSALLVVNRLDATVRGGELDASDDYVFCAAARLARVDVDRALALPTAIKAKMRSLTA